MLRRLSTIINSSFFTPTPNLLIMKYLNIFLIVFALCLLLVAAKEFQAVLGHIKTKTNDVAQASAALDLIKRIIPERVNDFSVEIDRNFGPAGKDTFYVRKTSNIIKITATTGVAAAWGFHHYLKYYCNAHISWESQQLNIPKDLPDVNVRITSNDRFRYYQNVCTTSYSFVWWSWQDWERHIDWMALNGINLALAFNGQEAIWKRVYHKFNISDPDIDQHFSGPAFLSWLRMGNMRGFGGPLSDNWHRRSLVLQKQIVSRMRALGIITVLPGFAGHVPRGIKKMFPEAKLRKMGAWMRFKDKYCCPYLLDPTDKLFTKIGITFMKEQIAEFGTDNVYNCDIFNEMTPQSNDSDYLQTMSKSIYTAMTDADPDAIWFLQAWAFYNEIWFWNRDAVKAFVTGVPKGRMVLLDLHSEQFPQYERLDSYFGQPFIWNMLHNFGGTLGMFGSATRINSEPSRARNFKNSSMIGSGLTPEGINQNYVIYDLMTEMFWRKEQVNLTKWFEDYALRRYGQRNHYAIKAWNILQNTVYNFDSVERVDGQYVISRSPRMNLKPWFWYNTTEFMSAWEYLLCAADDLKDNAGYRHDLVDVTRQVLQIFGDINYNKLIRKFREKKTTEFRLVSNEFRQIFSDLELILSTNEAFLLGRWLESAKATAMNQEEARLYEYNARNQISLWGPNGEILDYANKQWAGVVSSLFGRRWNMFLEAMDKSLKTGKPFDEPRVVHHVFAQVESPFSTATNNFSTHAIGDTIEVARKIYKRWRNKSVGMKNVQVRRSRYHQ